MEEFESWLTEYLNSAGVDGEVFSSYISGTLVTLQDAPDTEVEESLQEILQSCLEDESSLLSACRDIQVKWKEGISKHLNEEHKEEVIPTGTEAVSEKLREDATPPQSLMEEDTSKPDPKVMLSSEEKMKLLSLYGCEESDEDDSHYEGASGAFGGVYVNRNTSVVGEAQRLHREVLKASHEAKLERDRKDRETQKQKAQERKEKEKKRTQKQEKRR